jgi:hypothetical protein
MDQTRTRIVNIWMDFRFRHLGLVLEDEVDVDVEVTDDLRK